MRNWGMGNGGKIIDFFFNHQMDIRKVQMVVLLLQLDWHQMILKKGKIMKKNCGEHGKKIIQISFSFFYYI